MLGVREYPVPSGTVLHDFAEKPGYYTDCFATDVEVAIKFSDYVEAFYTTPLFKAERLVLKLFAGLPSTDMEAKALALGEVDRFAAWQAKERSDAELRMKALGRTSSWFKIERIDCGTASGTRLLFGSVVAPMQSDGNKPAPKGFLFSALLGPHRLYSKLLLASARRRLRRLYRVKRSSDNVAT